MPIGLDSFAERTLKLRADAVGNICEVPEPFAGHPVSKVIVRVAPINTMLCYLGRFLETRFSGPEVWELHPKG